MLAVCRWGPGHFWWPERVRFPKVPWPCKHHRIPSFISEEDGFLNQRSSYKLRRTEHSRAWLIWKFSVLSKFAWRKAGAKKPALFFLLPQYYLFPDLHDNPLFKWGTHKLLTWLNELFCYVKKKDTYWLGRVIIFEVKTWSWNWSFLTF